MKLSFFLAGCLAFTGSAALAQQTPTTLYLHGNILTGAHLTGSLADGSPDRAATPARVEALAVAGETVVAVGSDADILKLKGPATEVIDLHGAFVMPGFNDAHVHLAAAGQQKLSVNLDATPSLADMLQRIRTYTSAARPGQWILGAGWDQTRWPGATLPTRGDLDKVTGEHPAMFYRTDGHIVVANTAALKAASITASTDDPVGAKIDRDSDGEPTGIVREAPAIALLTAKIPPPDPDTRRRALDLALSDAVAHGVTSLQDFSEWEDWLVMETMEHRGELPVRIAEWVDFNLPVPVLKTRYASHPAGDLRLHLTMLKGFMDGSLGSRTAALAAPYADDPRNAGLPRYDQEKLNRMAEDRAAAGFQLGFHAIGDEANTMALNAFAAAEQVAVPADARPLPASNDDGIVTSASRPAPAPTPKSFRLRIEHAQVLLPGDFDRMRQLGVVASMQPSHLLTDMKWAEARLGPERAQYSYAWRSMLDHGIPLAFGTDFPVEAVSPFRGLYSAVTRKNEAGTQQYHPEQRITLAEAVFAYTQGAAYAEFRETHKGRLEPGFLADFVLLSRDPFAVPPEQLLTLKVLCTVVGGRTVYTATAQPLSPAPAVPAARTGVPDED